ncbi:MAG: TIGR02757 family protein [Bacteroidetes bacterium]|nr:MAG: TIGR02757 family protein [Bacteroidota bacterium]
MTEKALRSFLEEKAALYNRTAFVDEDPISIPHLFSKREDIEIAAFLTATISWGQRKSIIKNAITLMDRMDRSPHEFIQQFKESDLKVFRSFKHRTFNGDDCIFFLKSLQKIYKKHRNLEAIFTSSPLEDNPIKEGIIAARNTFFSLPHQIRHRKHFSDPERGSAAKRLNMFLRWMVRKDEAGVDLGIWKRIRASELMCPLDVHSGRVARKLGLLTRRHDDWQSVQELTQRLRKFDPIDPVKYDYALFGLGVFEKF